MTPAEIQTALEAAGPLPRRRRDESIDDFSARLVEWALAGGGIPTSIALGRCLQTRAALKAPESFGPDEALPTLAYRSAQRGGSVSADLFAVGAPS